MTAVHVSVLLDRSGSMTTIADDVIKGFNEFLAEQRDVNSDAVVSLVQFDSEQPHEVLIDAMPLREVTDLDRSRFEPRGTTPLYDAGGLLITRIDSRVASLAEQGFEAEDQVVLIITDGLENASREHTRSSIFDLISKRRDDGWVFAFLGADQDSYAEGARLGVAADNRRDWDRTSGGTKKMWKDASLSLRSHAIKSSKQRFEDRDSFLEDSDEE